MRPERPASEDNQGGLSREIFLTRDFFNLVRSGLKTLELRVAFPSFSRISFGDIVVFSSGRGEKISVKITSVRRYQTLEEILTSEDLTKLAPGMTVETARAAGRSLFKESDIKKHGLLILGFEKVV